MNLLYLKQLRLSKKISQQEMAEAIGLTTAGGYHRIETGEVRLKAHHLPAIAEKLGVSVNELSSKIFLDNNLSFAQKGRGK